MGHQDFFTRRFLRSYDPERHQFLDLLVFFIFTPSFLAGRIRGEERDQPGYESHGYPTEERCKESGVL